MRTARSLRFRIVPIVVPILAAAVIDSCRGLPLAAPSATSQPATAAVPVQPVVGLPAGTDGFPWWNDTVFYEVFVRSFFDSNGDGKGDLSGLTAKLEYLQDLGVTGLWLMPIQPAASYHGYDVLNYYAVNPDYGTLDDMRELLAAAHVRGMRVILDLVVNHTSSQHPWFLGGLDTNSPYHDWYIWSPHQADPNLWHPAPPPSSGYYYGFFSAGMPDLNYTNPAVTAQMESIVRFWMQDIGVDGFRVDAAKYLIEEGGVTQNSDATHAWYRDFRAFYKRLNPQALTVGEVQDISPTAASYAQGDQLDLTFDFSLAESFVISARTGRAEDALQTLAADTQRSFKPLQLATFLTNHDQNRARSQLAGSFDKARVAAAMLLTSPGVPFVYYGEEIGMLGLKPDERIRSPMEWSPETGGGFSTTEPWETVNADYRSVNVAGEAADPNSLLSFYKTLIRLRNQHAALRVGDFVLITADNSAVFACLRRSERETILVVINLSSKPVGDLHLTLASGPLSGTYLANPALGAGPFAPLSANTSGGFDRYQPTPSLPAFGALVLQLLELP